MYIRLEWGERKLVINFMAYYRSFFTHSYYSYFYNNLHKNEKSKSLKFEKHFRLRK